MCVCAGVVGNYQEALHRSNVYRGTPGGNLSPTQSWPSRCSLYEQEGLPKALAGNPESSRLQGSGLSCTSSSLKRLHAVQPVSVPAAYLAAKGHFPWAARVPRGPGRDHHHLPLSHCFVGITARASALCCPEAGTGSLSRDSLGLPLTLLPGI